MSKNENMIVTLDDTTKQIKHFLETTVNITNVVKAYLH